MDYFHKLSNELVEEYDYLCFEDLNIDGMKRMWGRKVSDLSFSTFLSILEHKCLEKGKKLLKVGRFYPSSKTCNICQNIYKGLKLGEDTWTCSVCSTEHDRDRNAAINIEARALA